MPIVDSLYKIIYKGNSLDGSIQNVLGQDMIKDVEFINKQMSDIQEEKIIDVGNEEFIDSEEEG